MRRFRLPSISFDPLPYDADTNDPILSGTSSLCFKNSPDSLAQCPSKACLLTSKNTTSSGKLEACCAWDLPVWLYEDPAFTKDDVTIPAIYLTLEQGQQLLKEVNAGSVQAMIYARYRPAYNPSALLIWALGVMVAAMAAYSSSSEYRSATKDIERHMQTAAADAESGDRGSGDQMSYQRAPPAEETLELSAEHALGFIVMASAGLFILFFFKVSAVREVILCMDTLRRYSYLLVCTLQIYNVVKVMYALGCSKAVTQVIFYPIVSQASETLAHSQ